MIRLTVRLPDDLHGRLVKRSRAAGKSLNQLIVEGAAYAASGGPAPQLSERERWRLALGDLLADTEALFEEPGDEDTPLLSYEELDRIMPRLDPPLSQTIIEDREDRV